MDTIVIAQKLESLRRCLKRVEEKCPEDHTLLLNDLDLQDIIVLNLTRAIQLCVDIASHIISHSEAVVPSTMAGSFSTLEGLGILDPSTASSLRKSVGFRNIAVHNYEEVNWKIVHSICRNKQGDFQQFAKSIIRYSGL